MGIEEEVIRELAKREGVPLLEAEQDEGDTDDGFEDDKLQGSDDERNKAAGGGDAVAVTMPSFVAAGATKDVDARARGSATPLMPFRPQIMCFVRVQKPADCTPDEFKTSLKVQEKLIGFLHQLNKSRGLAMVASVYVPPEGEACDGGDAPGNGSGGGGGSNSGNAGGSRSGDDARAQRSRFTVQEEAEAGDDAEGGQLPSIAVQPPTPSSHGRASSSSARARCHEQAKREQRKVVLMKLRLAQMMQIQHVRGFVEVVTAPNVDVGKQVLMQTAGLGPLKPNTCLLGFPQTRQLDRVLQGKTLARHVLESMEHAMAERKAMLMVRHLQNFPEKHERMEGTIDVWWVIQDGGFLLLVAYLLRKHRVWSRTKLRLFTVAEITGT